MDIPEDSAWYQLTFSCVRVAADALPVHEKVLHKLILAQSRAGACQAHSAQCCKGGGLSALFFLFLVWLFVCFGGLFVLFCLFVA